MLAEWMVGSNNQLVTFLDMLAWSEGTDNGRQKTENHGYGVIVSLSCCKFSDHPRKLVTLNPKPKSTGLPDATSFFPVGGMPTASSLAWKTSLRKVRTLWHCSRLSWRFTYDWSWWYPSGNRPLRQYLGFTAGRFGYGQFEHKADSLIAKFKAGGTVREIDVWAESPRLSPLWLSASSSACHGLLIITVITPLPTKPSATKMPENWSWRTWQLLTCRCVSVMLLRSMQNTRRSCDAKAEAIALRDDVAAGRRRLHIKAMYKSVRDHHRLRRG